MELLPVGLLPRVGRAWRDVGRDIPHGTGAESAIHAVSCQKSVSSASTRITRLICDNVALSRLFSARVSREEGKQMAVVFATMPQLVAPLGSQGRGVS
jgi:hypothetical protein